MKARTNERWGAVLTVGFLLLAVVVVVLLYEFLVAGGTSPRLFDLHTFWLAGRDYLYGRDPYPTAVRGPITRGEWFVYPAPVAALFAPLGALPYPIASGLMSVALIAAAAGALWLVGVRDWRCYVLAFGSVALHKALNLGTLTPVLMLLVAAVWRLRRRGWPLAAAVAGAVILKLFLWPLLVWTLATGRRRASVQALAIILVSSLVACLPILGSLGRYPTLLHELSVHEAWSGYGLAGLAAAAGASQGGAAVVAVGGAPLAALAVWWACRRFVERRALSVALAVSIVASPVVWEHYFALASICVALWSPALSVAWLGPLALWFSPSEQAWASGWRIALGMAVLGLPYALEASRAWRQDGVERERPAGSPAMVDP